MKLFEIFGVVNVDTKSAEKGLADVDKKGAEVGGSLSNLSKKAANVGKGFTSAGKKLTSVGASMSKGITAPVVALGAGVLALANNASSMADEVHKGSQRMGISMKNYQELDFWASQNGLSHGSLERAVGRLNQRMGLAAGGNEKYSEALEKLGVDMDKVLDGSISTEDAFAQSIKTLSELTSEQEKSALASELFGTKLARDLLPSLQDGALSLEDAKKQAKELGIVLGDDSIIAGVEFQDAMDGVQRSLSAAFAKLGMELLPLIQDTFLPLIQDTIIPMIGNFAEKIGALVEKFQSLSPGTQEMIVKLGLLLVALGPILLVVGNIITVVGSLISAFSTVAGVISSAGGVIALLTNPIGIAIAAIAAIIAIGVALYKNWDKIMEFGKKLGEGLANIWKSIVGTIKEAFDNIMNFGKDLVSGLVSRWESLVDGTKKTFKNIADAMLSPITKVYDTFKKIVERIKKLFKFEIKFPKIKAPKWLAKLVPSLKDDYDGPEANPEGGRAGGAKAGKRFFAKGGYMNKPTEFARVNGVSHIAGEAGGEGIVPLEGRHMAPFANYVAKVLKDNNGGGAQVKNEFNIASLVVREEADIRRIAEELEALTARKNRLRGAY